ncbi:MAG: Type 1 glutamine amidotransferase-like domain-containing protein [Patescibacteria group bacterium]|jgi:peptidase E
MTKFILHGGGSKTWNETERQENYQAIARVLTNGFKTPVKVLLIYFARVSELWDEKFAEDKVNFSKEVTGVDRTLEVANPDPKLFEEQIKKSDIIFVRGGNTKLLMDVIQQTPHFGQLLKDKVYFGSSAGAYLVSKYYYSNDRYQIEEGLGILPIKCFAHWDESQQKSLEELEKYGEELPVTLLKEGEYKIIN